MANIETINLTEVINLNLIDLSIKATNKEAALKDLTHLLYQQGCINDEAAFFKDVLLREQEGLTGLGKGIAIPHGKSPSVLKTTIAIGRVIKPIDWESLDEKQVAVIILFAVKDNDATTVHIKLLQKIAIMLADDDFLEKLKTVQTPEEMQNLFLSKNI